MWFMYFLQVIITQKIQYEVSYSTIKYLIAYIEVYYGQLTVWVLSQCL